MITIFEVIDHGRQRARPAIAGPSAWNSLVDPVRNPNATEAAFRRSLKTLFSVRTVQYYGALNDLWGFTDDASYK